MNNEIKTVFTTGEVAEICGVTLRTVINWIKQGRLAAYQLPGRRGDNRIERKALEEFLKQNNMPRPASWGSKDAANHQIDCLIVDDDQSMARAIARILRAIPLTTHIASNGFEAGQMYSLLKPAVMTLDLSMPGMDGFAVLEQLKQRTHTKILVVSALPDHDLKKALNLGADDILAKPFENEDLLKKINKLTANPV